MPGVIPPVSTYFLHTLDELNKRVRALETQQQQIFVDSTLTAQAIAGNLVTDNVGAATGLTGWGFGHKNLAGIWVGLSAALSPATNVQPNTDSCTSTTPTNLAHAGPSITFTTGPSGLALLFANALISVGVVAMQSQVYTVIDGGTPAFIMEYSTALTGNDSSASCSWIFPYAFTPSASHTVEMQYAVTAGTGAFGSRTLAALIL